MENNALLKRFKERMRVFHDVDDENINNILNSSEDALNSLLGFDLMTIESGKELIMERSRYVYNDSLELFYDSFKNEIARLAMYGLEKEYESKNTSTF
ncbi:phage head-tail connector protein [Streptococcus iniae]|uniref:phage head-tail connector protein n=1 Tax=Streptococcus iniae TaxID=1346 RepID=UPI000EF73C71|nr:phage gp6-like head-tail connector protein [Streptococcus iniae]RLV18994.1 phage gp6-like head-tail connector protein [Streptococcus iniae]